MKIVPLPLHKISSWHGVVAQSIYRRSREYYIALAPKAERARGPLCEHALNSDAPLPSPKEGPDVDHAAATPHGRRHQ